MPVFLLFLVALMEFGHIYLVIASLQSAAKIGARIGAVDNNHTTDVEDAVNRVLGSAFDRTTTTVLVKDASIFDQPGVQPETINYSSLPDVEVDSLESGQLFVVRVTVPYDDVALLPPFWAKGIVLSSQSVMRRE